jgi:hypothetical protein
MANILVNHGGTVHESMSNIDVAKSSLNQTDLFEVTKQISKDQTAYGTLNGGLNQAMVADIHDDGQSGSTESLIRAGRTVGFLEEARLQAQGDPKTAEFEAKPLFDKAISYIPVASGDVQQGFDYVTAKWLEDEQKRLDQQATDDSIEAYKKRNGQLAALSEEWGKSHGVSADSAYSNMDEIEESAQSGVSHAQGISGAGAAK